MNWATAHFSALYSQPQNCHGACGCVIWLADVLQWSYIEDQEAQSLVEIDLSAILDPFGSNQFMSCPQVLLFSCALSPSLLFQTSFL